MGLRCLFAPQRALKMGHFYWLHVKNSNHLHTEVSLGFLKDAKLYLERKASFIDISSIASFKLFLIAWLREYCTFSAKIHPVGNYFPKKKIVFHYQTLFLLQMCSLLDCS